ncbi:MAG: DUF1810 family protein [Gammaproteobacteria bacterium]|nr:MAG: DUF1810 family protein [Gammaproteobacteria bacterium]
MDAQKTSYADALSEIRYGQKRSHWIWYIFPQLKGLGFSSMSQTYGLANIAEARAYLIDPILGQRLRESVEAMLAHESLDANLILGELDAMKFRSCLTLFSFADPTDPLFSDALERFFAGQRDDRTVELLKDVQ